MARRYKRRSQRRADPEVGGLTLLRDDIRERRARKEEPKALPKAWPSYRPPRTNPQLRLEHVRERLRTESMPTREREQLQAIERDLVAKLEAAVDAPRGHDTPVKHPELKKVGRTKPVPSKPKPKRRKRDIAKLKLLWSRVKARDSDYEL